MKSEYLLLLTALAFGQPAVAADANDKSPYDKSPACLDRTTDSSSGDCIVKDTGTPRQTYPPKASTPAAGGTPAVPAAPGSTISRTPPARAPGGGVTGGK